MSTRMPFMETYWTASRGSLSGRAPLTLIVSVVGSNPFVGLVSNDRVDIGVAEGCDKVGTGKKLPISSWVAAREPRLANEALPTVGVAVGCADLRTGASVTVGGTPGTGCSDLLGPSLLGGVKLTAGGTADVGVSLHKASASAACVRSWLFSVASTRFSGTASSHWRYSPSLLGISACQVLSGRRWARMWIGPLNVLAWLCH